MTFRQWKTMGWNYRKQFADWIRAAEKGQHRLARLQICRQQFPTLFFSKEATHV